MSSSPTEQNPPTPGPEGWTVYILESEAGTLYTGITRDLERRLKEHAGGKKGARFFNTSPPARLVYQESAASHSAALRREAAIKRLTRRRKLELIHNR